MQLKSNNGSNLYEPQLLKRISMLSEANKLIDVTIREQEIDLFLAFSLMVSAAETKKDLKDVLSQHLHRMFPISDYVLFTINKDKKTYSIFFHAEEDQAGDVSGFSDITNKVYLINDGYFEHLLSSEIYYSLKINEVAINESTPEYISHWKVIGVAEVVALPIRKHNQNIGMLFMRVESKVAQKSVNFGITTALSSQIAAKISEIAATSEIERRDKAREMLLTLNSEITTVRNNDELLQVIDCKLKNLLSFRHSMITKINDDKTTVSPLFSDKESKNSREPFENKINALKMPIFDGVMDKAISSSAPIIICLDGTGNTSGLPFYLKVNNESKIRLAVMVRFSKEEDVFGFWTIYFEDQLQIDPDAISIISVLANQLSIAVLNIITYEEIARREEQAALLNSLSNEIAALRNRNDLFHVVNNKIKKLFSISEFGIAQINDDQKTYGAFVLELQDSIKKKKDYHAFTSDTYSINDPVFSSIMRSDLPILFQVKELVKLPGVPVYVKFWESAGINAVLSAALRVGGKTIGCVYLHVDNDSIIKEKYNLLKGVCAQLAVAISNILAIEEIARREREREVLLSLNTYIAAVRSNEELLHVINKRLKTLLEFDHSLIGIVNEDGITASAFLIDPDTLARNHPIFESSKKGKYPIKDGVMEKAALSSVPLTYNLAQLKERQPLPIYFQLNYEIGIRYAVITRFSKGENAFGFWMIFFNNQSYNNAGKRNLIGGLANQISIAVSNIIANDEIKRRELEKTKILTFSNAIASVRDRHVLAKILARQLKELFNISEFAIHAISEDKKTHRVILYDVDAAFATHPDFQQIVNSESAIVKGLFEHIIEGTGPVSFNIENWGVFKKSLNYFNINSLQQLVGVPICMAEEPIAVMIFTHDQFSELAIQKSLFRSICSQIAITVANIVANEKADRHLNEINSYKRKLEEEKTYLKEEIESTHNYSEIIGNSPEIQRIFQLVSQVAASDSTVLLLGETGTGKELIARAIHNGSPRKSRLMIKVNCAALPANLIESELFGHERGSFTGAIERRIGKFELANNGTLFLDEIGEMPLDLQVKLLRALQEREIERVGGKNTIKVDVRIIAATNRDLEKEMREGRFRSDLYYRINIFPIALPPLRERKQDIPPLTAYFIDRLAKKAGKNISGISKSVLQQLHDYSWPGNIRELEHLIERSVLLTTGETIKQVNLPAQSIVTSENLTDKIVVIKTIDEFERGHILKTLKFCGGRIAGKGGAAELLGIPASTLNSKMKKLGIKKEHSL